MDISKLTPNATTVAALREAETAAPWDRELIKAIAMDIGKEVVAYIEVMYPNAIKATSSTFKLSVRNCIHNEIMAAIEVNDAGQIAGRIKDRKRFRREWLANYREIRRKDEECNPVEGEQLIRELAQRLDLVSTGWLPTVGKVKNITFSLEEAEAVKRALLFFADIAEHPTNAI